MLCSPQATRQRQRHSPGHSQGGDGSAHAGKAAEEESAVHAVATQGDGITAVQRARGHSPARHALPKTSLPSLNSPTPHGRPVLPPAYILTEIEWGPSQTLQVRHQLRAALPGLQEAPSARMVCPLPPSELETLDGAGARSSWASVSFETSP